MIKPDNAALGELYKSARKGDDAAIKHFINTYSKDFIDDIYDLPHKRDYMPDRFQTALMAAAQAGQINAVEILLEAGADPHMTNFESKPSVELMLENRQISNETRIKILESMLRHGMSVNIRISGGNSLLMHAACTLGLPDWADKLIASGADIHFKEDRGYSIIMYAAQGGNMGLIKKLLECGADPFEKNKITGSSALDYAREYAHEECVEQIEAWKTTQQVLAAQENFSAGTKRRVTLLNRIKIKCAT